MSSSGQQRSMNTDQRSANHSSARPNHVVLPHFSDILQPRSAAPATSYRRVDTGQHTSHRPAQYTNLGSSEFPFALALDAPTDDAVTPYIPDAAPRRREVASYQVRAPTTRILPKHINLITPAKLEAYDDLAIFAGPASPLPTVAFSPSIDLGELLWFYGLDFPKAKRTFRTDRDLRKRWCSAVRGERQCRACLHDHCRADGSVEYHVGLGQRRCAWAQCCFVVPHDVGDDKAPRALSAHMALTHFCQTLMCPLCKRALKIAEESGYLAYDVIARHLATGLCLGLAKYALEKAQPVPRPNLGADPGIVEGEDAPRFRV